MLLASKYKTLEGARKRAAFENSVATSEYEHGYKAKLYRYSVVQDDYYPGIWRVARDVAQKPGKETP
jgi:hypothetical protein